MYLALMVACVSVGVLCVSHVPGTCMAISACVSVGVLCVSHVPGTCMLRQV